jgi:hypothetical protein
LYRYVVEHKKSRAYQNLIKSLASEIVPDPDLDVIAVKASEGKTLTDAEKEALRRAMEEEDEEEDGEEGTTGMFGDYAGDDEAQAAAVKLQALQRGRAARAKVAAKRKHAGTDDGDGAGVGDAGGDVEALAMKAAAGKMLTEGEKAALRAAAAAEGEAEGGSEAEAPDDAEGAAANANAGGGDDGDETTPPATPSKPPAFMFSPLARHPQAQEPAPAPRDPFDRAYAAAAAGAYHLLTTVHFS